MLIRYDNTGSIHALATLLDEMRHHSAVTAILILACDGNGFQPADVDPLLQESNLPLFGGIFPGVLYGKCKFEKGTIVVGFQQPVKSVVIRGLNDDDARYSSQLSAIAADTGPAGVLFLFADGYSSRIGDLLSAVEDLFPKPESCIGGGAGSAAPLMRGAEVTPSVFTNQGLLQGCAVVAQVGVHCGVGVRHGFEPVEGPFQVTEQRGNVLVSLDGEPALKVYKNLVSQYSHQEVNADNLPDLLKAYPLGLISPESGFLVRDLLAAHGEELVTVSRIKQGEFVYLVNGNIDTLIGAAIEANKAALRRFGNRTKHLTILVECISRAIFLGDDLERELSAISEEDHPVIGFFSLGEIARNQGEPAVLYNKTCIVGVLGE